MTTIADITEALAAADGAAGAARIVRVKWRRYQPGAFSGIDKRGHVTRTTAAVAWVVPDGAAEAEPLRAGRDGSIRLDILTPHELAIERWAAEVPATTYVIVSTGLGGRIEWGDDPHIRVKDRPRDVDNLVYLSELQAETGTIAAWLKRRPVAVKVEICTTCKGPIDENEECRCG